LDTGAVPAATSVVGPVCSTTSNVASVAEVSAGASDGSTERSSGSARSIGRIWPSEPPVGTQPVSASVSLPSPSVSPGRQSRGVPLVGMPTTAPESSMAAPPLLPPETTASVLIQAGPSIPSS
jgi:hypothetical protein